MQKTLFLKAFIIGVLGLLLLIPLMMIDGIIRDRQWNQRAVVQDISRSSVGAQTVAGPILVIPYTYTKMVETQIRTELTQGTRRIKKTFHDTAYVLPQTLDMTGDSKISKRYRGIFEVPVYHANLKMTGKFTIPAQAELLAKDDLKLEQAYLSMKIADVRGIERNVVLKADGKALSVQPGAKAKFLGSGIHADIDLQPLSKPQSIAFDIRLPISGLEKLSFIPSAKQFSTHLTSDWPHPSFDGKFLPKQSNISDKGFDAKWQVSVFASNIDEVLQRCGSNHYCDALDQNAFSISFIEGVNVYQKSERAIKYAILFIGLTFAAFFLFEVIKALPIHPIQYGFVGISLAVFYLMLISLSEHIAFGYAYLMATLSCTAILGVYLTSVLKSMFTGTGFAAALTALYGVLFLLIQSEDFALLAGTAVVFTVLAAAMLITRKIDWYNPLNR